MMKRNPSTQLIQKRQSIQYPGINGDDMRLQGSYATYVNYLSTLSLSGLQKQLSIIKEKEKQYYKLNGQLKLLEKKSRILTQQQKNLLQIRGQQQQDQEIAQLKAQIQGITLEIRNITEQGKSVKKQCLQGKEELKQLEIQLQRINGNNCELIEEICKKKEKLKQKLAVAQEMRTAKQLNEQKILELRQQIRALEKQLYLVQKELANVIQEKQMQDKNKERLRKVIEQLQREVMCQQSHEKQTHSKLSQTKHQKQQLQQELQSLTKEEQQMSLRYEQKLQEYHKLSVTTKQSQLKLLQLKDQLEIVQNDIVQMNQQFINEAEELKRQEEENQRINDQFDCIGKEAVDVWRGICELLRVQECTNNQNLPNSNKKSMGQNINEIKFKALKLWKEIQQIINVNSIQ